MTDYEIELLEKINDLNKKNECLKSLLEQFKVDKLDLLKEIQSLKVEILHLKRK